MNYKFCKKRNRKGNAESALSVMDQERHFVSYPEVLEVILNDQCG